MANIDDINDKDLCTKIVSINGKLLTNLYSANEILKSCSTCTAISLAPAEDSCESACRGRCAEYYTDGSVGSLQVGDHIYTNDTCSDCVANGYYADAACRGSQGCFTVGAGCAITEISECR